jgi:hypothetical protein
VLNRSCKAEGRGGGGSVFVDADVTGRARLVFSDSVAILHFG